MKKVIVLFFVLYLPVAGKAQINLVLNPSFEQYSICPDNWDEPKYCYHWMSLDSSWSPPDWAHDPPGVPEYVNACAAAATGVSVPIGVDFNHYPRSGNGLMSIQMYSDDSASGLVRDYLQGHLSQTLTAGHTYNVRFYTILGQRGGYAVNGIGAYFDNGTIDSTHKQGIVQYQYNPQVIDTSIISDTLNWTEIEDTFTANGTEKLITIGQFYLNYLTNKITVPWGTALSWAWYQVDDVSVIDCSNVPFAGNDTTIIYPWMDSIFLGTHEPLLPYTWYLLDSTNPIDSGGGIWVHPTHNTSYVVVQKLCGITRTDTVTVHVIWEGVANLKSTISQLQLYPNPATKELTIEHAANCEVVLYDVTGRAILQTAIQSDKQLVDISMLASGVYLVQVTDTETSEKVTRKVIKE